MLAKIGDLWGGSDARGRSDEPGTTGPPAKPQPGARSARGRSNRRIALRVAAACVSAVAVLSLAACSSSGSGSSNLPSGSGSSSSSDANSSGSPQGANVAAATAALAPYTGHPSAFPATGPLPYKLPAGKKFVFLQCGTPNCALAGTSLKAAVAAIGGKYIAVNAGTTASSSQAAASTALALKPDVVVMTVDPALFGDGLKKLSAAGAKVISISIAKDATPFGVTFNYIGVNDLQTDGKLLADWVFANNGTKANSVFYGLPAFDASLPEQQAFVNEMKKNCPSCTVRTVPIDASTIGTTAPNTIVADLQAHPATNVAVFVTMQIAQGLPAAMRAAGLKGITTVGRNPDPSNLQDIKTGALTAGLAIDEAVSTWAVVDAAARLLEGGQPTASEEAGEVEQFLGQNDITFNTTNGWIGYSDFEQRFETLWHTGG
jgi:ribose transport system substrate-binding protein